MDHLLRLQLESSLQWFCEYRPIITVSSIVKFPKGLVTLGVVFYFEELFKSFSLHHQKSRVILIILDCGDHYYGCAIC